MTMSKQDKTPDSEGRPLDKFAARARHVLALAQEEARGFNHNYIGTEHLLLGGRQRFLQFRAILRRASMTYSCVEEAALCRQFVCGCEIGAPHDNIQPDLPRS
jgi:hypothetical protein